MFRCLSIMAVAVSVILAGCGQKEAADSGSSASAELEKVVVTGAPAKAPLSVLAAKKEAKNGDPVAVEGKVKDFIEGAAAFTLADHSLKSCTDRGDKCTTPWDYCCEDRAKLTAALATVKVVGPDHQPLAGTLKGVRNLTNLTTVTVEGKAVKDDNGNLTVEAEKIYIKS